MPPFGGFGGFEVNKPQTTHFRPNFIFPPNLPYSLFPLWVCFVSCSSFALLPIGQNCAWGFPADNFFFFCDRGAIVTIGTGESCIVEVSSSNSLLTNQQHKSVDFSSVPDETCGKNVRSRKVLNGRVAELAGGEEMRRKVPEQTA